MHALGITRYEDVDHTTLGRIADAVGKSERTPARLSTASKRFYDKALNGSPKPKAPAADIPGIRDMPLHQLARMARRDWSQSGKGVNYAAKPYLDAMHSLEKITDTYGADSGDSVVAYFLGNATSWKGPVAKTIKAELKRRLGRK
jgi:hypothetical protein